MPQDTPTRSPAGRISLQEAARRLGISERTLRRIRQRDEIEIIQVSPGRIMISEAALNAYVDRQTRVVRTRRTTTKRRRRA